MRLAVALLGAAGISRGWAQSATDTSDYTPAMAYPRLSYIKMDAEGDETSISQNGSAGSTKFESLYLAPTVGVEWNYFLYHPNLLTYSLLAEPGYSWETTGSPGDLSQQQSVLLNGTLNATLLREKPYATTFFANAGRDTYNYDFYNTAVVDSHLWGVTSGYTEGPVPFTVSYQNSVQDSTGFLQSSSSENTTVNLHARNERQGGDASDLTYLYGDYAQSTSISGAGGSPGSPLGFADTSEYQYVTLTDTEVFRRSALNSTLLFNQVDESGSSSEDLNELENYGLQLTPNLRNTYDYSLSYYDSDGADSVENFGRVGLQHQLYQSLASSVDVHGSEVQSGSFGSSLDSTSGGTTASVDYSKILGAWGHLSMSDNGSYDFTSQDSTGSDLLVPNESHVLNQGQWVRLSQPQDIAIVSVTTDAAHGSLPLNEGPDYILNRSQNPWQIQLNPLSVTIHSGATVLVSYTVQPNPSGNYTVVDDEFQIRLDFWHNHADVYARYNLSANQASSPAFVLENINEFQAGADANWQGFRLTGNYDDRRSSFYTEHSIGLGEGYSRVLSSHATAGINLGQQWSFYPGGGGTNSSENITHFTYTAHYDWRLSTTLDWSTEGGLDQQRGDGVYQNLIAARTYLNWRVGKLEVHLGYEYQNDDYQAQSSDRNYIFLRAKRSF
jgi:hypothetical protein